MNKQSTSILRARRHRRVRAKISGTAERPRLTVFRSLHGMSAQVIDDVLGKTLLAASFHDLKLAKAANTVSEAAAVGTLIAERCVKQGIKTIVFDRSGYQYHGKVKALAEAARAAGLIF